MTIEPLYRDLFTTALAHTQPSAFDACIMLAEEARPRVTGLTNAQLSGLVELATTTTDIEKIKSELEKRNTSRWKSKDDPGPGNRLVSDIIQLRSFARDAVVNAEDALGRSMGGKDRGLAPGGRNPWIDELHLALTRRYLVAVATLARIGKEATSGFIAEKES